MLIVYNICRLFLLRSILYNRFWIFYKPLRKWKAIEEET